MGTFANHLPNNLSLYHHLKPFSNPQTPISPFAFTSPSSPSLISPNPSNPQNPKFQFGPFLIPTIAATASAFFFIRLHQNPPIIINDLGLETIQEDEMKDVSLKHKPGFVQSLTFLRVKQGTIVRLMDVGVNEWNNYESLKARIRSTADWLEIARRELEEVVERDPCRVMEYSQVVDELMDILRDMEVYIERCEKENVKGYLRSCNRLLARVRKMEGQILDALRQFHEEEED